MGVTLARSRGGRRATCTTLRAARPPPTATVLSPVRHQSRQRPVDDTFAREFRRGSVLFGGLFGKVAWRSLCSARGIALARRGLVISGASRGRLGSIKELFRLHGESIGDVGLSGESL
jgi:hypothetical protein